MRMKLLIIALLLSITASAQYGYDYNDRFRLTQERNYFRQEGWKSLSIGLLAHTGSLICVEYGPLTDPDVKGGFIAFTSVGVLMDLRAFYYFREAKRRNRMLHSISMFQ